MPSVKIIGAQELETALKELGPKISAKAGSKAIKAGGEVIADDMRIHVPVASGRLEESIVVSIARSDDVNVKVGTIGFRKPHGSRIAHLIEFGTVKMAPQPFIRPAIDSKSEDAIAVMQGILWKTIESEASKGKKV